jgi:hypothetical protein
MTSETDGMEASPLKSAAEELAFLRKMFRETVDQYAARIEADIAAIRESVLAEAKGKKAAARNRDARDMITLIRQLEIRPDKGRRRDLKKIDALVEELQRFAENW